MKKIIHVDMDSFYASVEVKNDPSLRGKPVAVGGRPEERSVICTASYEARKFGVKAGISSYKALKLCPRLILLPPDFRKYEEESEAIHDIFKRFTSKIEPLSLDEAYLDVTDAKIFKGSATLIAKEIRRLILKERSLTASAGIGPNKFLAKVASDWKKPNGQFTITPAMIDDFVKTLTIDHLYGVGKVTASKLNNMGIKTCADLQKYSLDELTDLFGAWGEDLYDQCRGIDERDVETFWERRSLGVEYTYPEDLKDVKQCIDELDELYDDLKTRLKNSCENKIIKSMFIKLKFCDFKRTTVERQTGTKLPSIEDYYPLIEQGFERHNKPVRLVGLGVRFRNGLKGFRDQKIKEQLEICFPEKIGWETRI
jgi:DNA polymerase IV